MTEIPATDAYSPAEIAHRVENMGVAKARASAFTLYVLAVLAGAFISLGGLLFIVIVTGSELGFGITRLLGGMGFSLGLILVVIAGAELFTGNNLLAMAWSSRLISTYSVLRNWAIVYAGNVTGCLLTVAAVKFAGIHSMDNGAVGDVAVQLALGKASLSPLMVFSRGVLCNALVCLAVWLTMGGHSVTDKILAILFPITAFVTMGFEHSIANWFFLPLGMILDQTGAITLTGVAANLWWSTLGNLFGGTVLVAGLYWLAYLRSGKKPA